MPDYNYDNAVLTRALRYGVVVLDLIAVVALLAAVRRRYIVIAAVGSAGLTFLQVVLAMTGINPVSDKHSVFAFSNVGVVGGVLIIAVTSWIVSGRLPSRGFEVVTQGREP